MLDRGELFSKTQLDAYYATLRCRFGPEVLVADPGQGAPARKDPELRWLHGDERFWELVGDGRIENWTSGGDNVREWNA